jgi:hypothetical protein
VMGASIFGKDTGWLTREGGSEGDPSLRLKNGFARDDKALMRSDKLQSALTRLRRNDGCFYLLRPGGAAFSRSRILLG